MIQIFEKSRFFGRKVVGFEYSFFKIGVLYLQWTKRTGKQKTPETLSPFSFAKEYRQ